MIGGRGGAFTVNPYATACACLTLSNCGNHTAEGGCRNSTGVGARLRAQGTPSLDRARDDLSVYGDGLPVGSSGLLFAGKTPDRTALFDGLICIADAGAVRRLRSFVATDGTFQVGPGILGWLDRNTNLVAGDVWTLQVFYRDQGGPCGQGANFSNGLRVTLAD